MSEAHNFAGSHAAQVILVVDDSTAIRRILRRGLEEAGYRVAEAANGEEALAIARIAPPGLILLDVDMPVMDGPTTLAAMKATLNLAEIPIIFLTARTGAGDVAVGLRLGAHDYLRKPCDPIELTARVASALRHKADADTLRRLAREADRASELDTLTGLGNRRWLGRRRLEMGSSSGISATIGVVMVDVDHFKRVNDIEGHATGDIVLRGLAGRLRLVAVEAGALAARWGGEEFVILAPGLDADQSAGLGETVRAAICDTPLPLKDGRTQVVTVSVGCASGPLHRWDTILQTADAALYEAKRGGRNRVASLGIC
jgi:diguanylate cyclase (GGDEF)-like protein